MRVSGITSPAQAVYDTVHDYGAPELAAALGIGYQVLVNKANPNNNQNQITLQDADRIMAKTGDMRVLEALAYKHGMMLVKAPTGLEHDGDVLMAMAAAMGANGGVADAIMDMLKDGRIEKHEVDAVAAAVRIAQARLAEIESVLRGMQEG